MKLITKLMMIATSGSMVGKNFSMADQNESPTAISVNEKSWINNWDQDLLVDTPSSMVTSFLLKIALRLQRT